MGALCSGIRKDVASEKKAAEDYTTRISQARGSGTVRILKHIRNEERGHKTELEKALSGLKGCNH